VNMVELSMDWRVVGGLIALAVLVIGYMMYRKEGLLISPHVTNIRQWPYYYYTLPYRYESGGAWPPNMYTRMSHWYPGYDVTGWSFDMRPGFGFIRFPRNRWLKNDGGHYYINNGGEKDRLEDYYRPS